MERRRGVRRRKLLGSQVDGIDQIIAIYITYIIFYTSAYHHIMMISAGAAGPGVSVNQSQRPKFVAVSTLEDVQVIIINICTTIVLALQSCSEGGRSSLLSLKPSNSRRCDVPSSTQAADSGRWGATVKH